MIIPYLKQKRQHQDENTCNTTDQASMDLAPERLLWPALFGSVALPLSFFWFAWSARVDVHWICPIIALGLFSWGNNLLYVSFNVVMVRI